MAWDQLDVSAIREEFPALQLGQDGRPFVFMDGPGGTQVSGSVIEAMSHHLAEANSNVHGGFVTSDRTDEAIQAARRAMADLFHASNPDEIVFGPNMTSLTFSLSRSIGADLSPGDEIIVSRLDHDANIAPWLALQEQGIVVRHVGFDPCDCTLDMPGLQEAISPRTKLVAVGYASNAVGTINDVRFITQLAHDVGAWVFVDAVHFAPHGPIDVQALDCDFLVCSVYKFFGPHAGVLYGRYDLLDRLPAYKVRPADDRPPYKFETGTQNHEALAGTTAAVDYLASVDRRFGSGRSDEPVGNAERRQDLVGSMTAIQAYERALCARLIAGMQGIPGLRIYGITDPERLDHRVPTISFTLDGLAPSEIAGRLAEVKIFAWAGNFYAQAVTEHLGLEEFGGLLRVGLVHYNTLEEVDTLLEVLADMPR